MKSPKKIGLLTAGVIALSVGTVVSLGGGQLFQSGGDGGWFAGLFSSPNVVRTASPRQDNRLADQSDASADSRMILDPVPGNEDLDSALERMASLPLVSLEAALAGAVSGDAAGMAKLQAFLDASGFNPNALEDRSNALFDALQEERDLAFTREETRDASRRIVSAAKVTAESAYLLPLALFESYTIGEDAGGYDIGPTAKAAYPDFQRQDETLQIVYGEDVRFFSDREDSTLLSDGALNFEGFALPTQTGAVRLYALSASDRLEEDAYPLPFGYGLTAGTQPYRVIDGRRATGTPFVTMDESGIAFNQVPMISQALEDALAADADDNFFQPTPLVNPVAKTQSNDSFATLRDQSMLETGTVLSVPVAIDFGGIDIAVRQLEPYQTNASAFIVGPDPLAPVLARLEDRARTFEAVTPLIASTDRQAPRETARAGQRTPRRPLGFQPVRTVDYPTALAGAMSGSSEGIKDLAAYLDAAGGNLNRLEDRAMALVEGLEAQAGTADFLTLADAANRITDATAKSAATTYLLPGFIGLDFDLPNPEAGWDMGADDGLPYSGFTRAADGSGVLIGSQMRSGRTRGTTPLVEDYVTRVEGLSFALPSAYYRTLVLVDPDADMSTANPLGNGFVINGAPQRLRDLRPLDPSVWSGLQAGRIGVSGGLDGYGPVDPRLEDMIPLGEGMGAVRPIMMQGGVFTALPPTGQTMDPNAVLPSGRSNTMVYASRAFVDENGALIVDFSAPPEGGTIVGAVIVGESDPEPLAERLAERIAQLLGSTAPASGFFPGDILPAAGTFFSNAFGLPVQVAQNLNGQTRYIRGGSIGPVGGGGFGTLAADTAGTDTAGTDTAGTDTAGTDTAGTDTAGTDTAGTDTAGTDTAGTDTAGTDTAGTDTAGTDTAGTDTAGTDTAGTDTSGTDTAGTDTAGTDTAGTDTAGTDTAGTDTSGTDTSGTDTSGTDTAGTDTAGTDTSGTDTAGTDTAGTDTAGTDTAGTDTAGTDTAGTDTAGTDTAGTDTSGTDTAGTDTAGTDTAGTDTAGTDTAGTDTAGTDTSGTDTAGTDTAGTDTAGTDTAGTDTAGTDTAGTDTAGTDTAGTDTAGTDTAGTDTAGTDTAGTDTAGTDTAGTDTAGTDTAGTDTAGTDTSGTDTAGTDTAGTDTAGTDTAGTDTAGTDTGGTDTGGDVILLPDAGGPYRVFIEEEFAFDGSQSVFNIDLSEFTIEWLLLDAGQEIFLATGLGTPGSPLQPGSVSFDQEGTYDIALRFTFGELVVTSFGLVIVVANNEIPVPATILLLGPGLVFLARIRRRRR